MALRDCTGFYHNDDDYDEYAEFSESGLNPFTDPAVQAQVMGQTDRYFFTPCSHMYTSSLRSTPRLSTQPSTPASSDIDTRIHSRNMELYRKERELDAKEDELRRREQELKKRERATMNDSVSVKGNDWAPFFPTIHFPDSNDIPIPLLRLQYFVLSTWIGICVCLLWNLVSVTAVWVVLKRDGPILWVFAVIYALSGIPGSYILWYRPLYRAMRNESDLKFGCFFVFYLMHLCFTICAAVAPPVFFNGFSLTGILSAIDMFSYSKMIGAFYMVGFGFFCLESVLTLWVLQQLCVFVRGFKRPSQPSKHGTIFTNW